MSIKKAGTIIFSLLIILIVILLTIKGCSFSKNTKENSSKNISPEVVLQEEVSTAKKEKSNKDGTEKSDDKSKSIPSNTPNKGVKEGENSNLDEVGDSTDSADTKLEKGSPSKDDKNIEDGSNLFKVVEEPTLGGSTVVDALVSGKQSYMVEEKSYAYSIGLIIPNGGNYNIINYYCPKKTYDAVKVGESVKVDYQLDSNNIISILSISK